MEPYFARRVNAGTPPSGENATNTTTKSNNTNTEKDAGEEEEEDHHRRIQQENVSICCLWRTWQTLFVGSLEDEE